MSYKHGPSSSRSFLSTMNNIEDSPRILYSNNKGIDLLGQDTNRPKKESSSECKPSNTKNNVSNQFDPSGFDQSMNTSIGFPSASLILRQMDDARHETSQTKPSNSSYNYIRQSDKYNKEKHNNSHNKPQSKDYQSSTNKSFGSNLNIDSFRSNTLKTRKSDDSLWTKIRSMDPTTGTTTSSALVTTTATAAYTTETKARDLPKQRTIPRSKSTSLLRQEYESRLKQQEHVEPIEASTKNVETLNSNNNNNETKLETEIKSLKLSMKNSSKSEYNLGIEEVLDTLRSIDQMFERQKDKVQMETRFVLSEESQLEAKEISKNIDHLMATLDDYQQEIHMLRNQYQ